MKNICMRLYVGAILCASIQPIDAAQVHFKTLYTFAGGSTGDHSYSGVIRDTNGNFYGTTYFGGMGDGCNDGCGTVFKVTADGTGKVLYSFAGGSDGNFPHGALLRDEAGNLYGTTLEGGGSSTCAGGCGTVFKLAPDGTETVVHAFAGGSDGIYPEGGVVADAAGNLYGTTEQGGGNNVCTDYGGSGTIFKIGRNGREKVLYSFKGPPDGCLPQGPLSMDAAGNLYGTTGWGGISDCPPIYCGTVFRLAPDGTETVLYSFRLNDGQIPYSKVIMDTAGNLYGTTVYGGAKGGGTVFRLAPDGTETVLYNFCSRPSCVDGSAPYAGLILDSVGNLYGSTGYGGNANCAAGDGCGTVFRLAPDGKLKTLHAFTGGSDGNFVYGDLIEDDAGHLYGTAAAGGIAGCGGYGLGCGTVFKLNK